MWIVDLLGALLAVGDRLERFAVWFWTTTWAERLAGVGFAFFVLALVGGLLGTLFGPSGVRRPYEDFQQDEFRRYHDRQRH